MSQGARKAVLDRIGAALGPRAAASPEDLDADRQRLPRLYDHLSRLSAAQQLDLLEERLLDYDAEVTRVTAGQVGSVLGAILQARGDRPVLVPEGFRQDWKPEGVSCTEDSGLSLRALDAFSAVLTAATLGIAETGTLVLQNVPGQGRRAATLVPDFHLCVLRAQDIVENVPQAFARLASTATLPTTFVSGPSATADIEMTRIKGVHGPRFLHIVIVLAEMDMALSVSV